MTKKINCIDGNHVHEIKKFAKFVFRSHVYDVLVNNKDRTFDIFLLKGVDMGIVDYWREFWPPAIRLIIKDIDEMDTIDFNNPIFSRK